MTPIEKFLKESYTPTIQEGKLGISCVFKHKDGVTDDSVVYFEFAKKEWTKKPIVPKRQYIIVDADMRDLLDFLNKYFNLEEENYHDVRKIIVDMAIESLDRFYDN
jgi:hypothetical protein